MDRDNFQVVGAAAGARSVRLLLADDHEVTRLGLHAILTREAGWEICGEAADGRQAVTLANRLRPDIVVMDIGMPELNGLEATRQIQADLPTCQVVIFTSQDSEGVVRDALLAGARAFVLKTDPAVEIVRAVAALQAGAAFFTPRIERLVLAGYLAGQVRVAVESSCSTEALSRREREVVQLLAEGKGNKQVAAALGVSTKTAETHRANVMHKLGLRSLSDLVHYAIRNHFVDL